MTYPQKLKYSFRKICCSMIGILSVGCLFVSISSGSRLNAYAVSGYGTSTRSLPDSLFVSGCPVGVRLESDGVTVLGFVGFMSDGTFVNPGANGGLQVGDCILKVDEKEVHSSEELRNVVSGSQNGKLIILVRRNQAEIIIPLQVYKDDEGGEYRIGVWVRDSITGIGTLTFYDLESGGFGALGHGISGENGLVSISGGTISKVTILGAVRGKPGAPGELKGYFPEPIQIAGQILSNCECGIMGITGDSFQELFCLKEYPVMPGTKVHTGKATILSTVCGDQPEEYEVEITVTLKDRIYATKGLTLKITDPRLIEQTGGIVQGMSGSPIIQDGCIVGAVTHVTMNDPTVGYGIYIEHMLATLHKARSLAS